MLIDHMSKGHSFESFGADVNAGRRTLYEWADNFEEFRDAKEIGHAKAMKLFESISVAKLSGKDVKNFDPKKSDTAMLIFYQKTRFHKVYGEKKTEVDDEDDIEFE